MTTSGGSTKDNMKSVFVPLGGNSEGRLRTRGWLMTIMTPLAVVLLLVTTTQTASLLSIRRYTATNTRSAIISIRHIHTANAVISNLLSTDQHHQRHSSLFVRRRQFLQATLSAAKATSTQLASYYSITSDNDNSRGSHSSSSSSATRGWIG
jgi:hypothetical protein